MLVIGKWKEWKPEKDTKIAKIDPKVQWFGTDRNKIFVVYQRQKVRAEVARADE